ncbi:MAG: hypothetical protein Q9217_000597 [Psora testacea]
MDYVEGTHLSDLLKKPTLSNQEKEILNPDIDDTTLGILYRQTANFMLQLYELDFTRIGAISEECCGSNMWSVTGRPLTYNMNELAASASYPIDQFPTESFASRNIVTDPEDARRRYISRHLFARLAARYPVNKNGPFKLFCDDLRPANILVNKKTLRITAVLDLEFTNAMPPQFAHDPPWWLLLVGPDMWLERGHTMQESNKRKRRRIDWGTMRDVCSNLMRNSWQSGDFWFNFAARKSLDVDAIFYTQLDQIHFGGNAGVHMLDDEVRAGIESFVQMKMEQKEAYNKQFSRL